MLHILSMIVNTCVHKLRINTCICTCWVLTLVYASTYRSRIYIYIIDIMCMHNMNINTYMWYKRTVTCTCIMLTLHIVYTIRSLTFVHFKYEHHKPGNEQMKVFKKSWDGDICEKCFWIYLSKKCCETLCNRQFDNS